MEDRKCSLCGGWINKQFPNQHPSNGFHRYEKHCEYYRNKKERDAALALLDEAKDLITWSTPKGNTDITRMQILESKSHWLTAYAKMKEGQ